VTHGSRLDEGEPLGAPTVEVIGGEPAEVRPTGVLVVAAVLLLGAVAFGLRDHAAADPPAAAPRPVAPPVPSPVPSQGSTPGVAVQALTGPRLAPPSAPRATAALNFVGSLDGRLVRLGAAAAQRGPAASGLVLPDATGESLFWVRGGRLWSVPAGLDHAPTDQGRAMRLVGSDPAGTMGVQVDPATVAMRPAAGIPGWSVAVPQGWRPSAVLDAGRLLVTHPDGRGAQRLAVVPRDGGVTQVPDSGRLLGADGDRFLVLPALSAAWHPALWIYRSPVGGDMDVEVVWPPRGWHFGAGPVAVVAGRAVLPVQADRPRSPAGRGPRTALAWLSGVQPASRLVPGSAGADPARALLATADGAAVFAAASPGGERLAVWRPDSTGPATWASGALPTGFRLSCTCWGG